MTLLFFIFGGRFKALSVHLTAIWKAIFKLPLYSSH